MVNEQTPMRRLNNFLYSDIKQKILFALVGTVNTCASYLAFVLLLQWIDNYIAASVISYGIGMIISYELNRRIVFKSEHQTGTWLSFITVNLTSMAISTMTLHVLVEYVDVYVYLAQAMAITFSMIINYLGYKAIFTYGVSMNQLLSTLSAPSFTSKISGRNVAVWALLVTLAIVTALNLHTAMMGNVAHDALNYMAEYTNKFTTEGRWINFMFFNELRMLPPVIAASLCNLFLFIFAYQVASRVGSEKWISLAFGLLVLNIPNFTMLFKWPMTLLPGCFMLALFALKPERLNRYVFVLLAGIVMFATYPAFYFLVPLLFLGQLGQESWKSIIKFTGIWILGYVVGYAVAQLSVYLFTAVTTEQGTFIKFASWRQSTPITDAASLWDNVLKSANNFKRNALMLSDLSTWFYLPIAGVFIWALKHHVKYSLMALMVVFSVYASVIAFGVDVPLRTGVTLPLGMAMFVLLIKNPWSKILLLVTLLLPFSYQMHKYNDRYNEIRATVANVLEKNDPNGYLKQSNRFKKIIITLDEAKTSEYLFELTQSDALKKIYLMKSHYIKPYLNQFGWKNVDIQIDNKPLDKISGESTVEVQGDTLLFNMY